jgi:glycosyltransferase involved in cell wall biosynthesis
MPNISIIIPCRNEAKHIAACIDSVLESGFPIENINEFILCDGNSSDETAAIIARYTQRFAFIQLLHNPEQTVPYALNRAIAHCTAPIIVRFDAHSTMQKGYINYGLEILENDASVGNVGGIFVNKYENEVAECVAAAMQSRFGVGNATFRLADRDGYVDTVPYGIFRAEIFEKTGLFDAMLTRNQDDEMNHRISLAGYKIYLDRRIKVDYMVRGSLTKLWQQYFQYGYFKVLVNRKHKTVTSVRQLIPMLFAAGIAGGLLLSLLSEAFFYVFITILSLYTILGLLAAFQNQGEKASLWRVFTIFKCFLILHLSYGLGYWNGISDFLILRKAEPKKV